MAKKSKKKESEHMEPVTNCDQSKELVANNDQLNDVVEITSAEDIDITKLIVVVRDQQVLIDRDIAMLYKVETKVLNQKVKRNVARFPERFRFQLTKQEMKELVTNCDRFESLKHSSSAPYAFTDHGGRFYWSFFTLKIWMLDHGELRTMCNTETSKSDQFRGKSP